MLYGANGAGKSNRFKAHSSPRRTGEILGRNFLEYFLKSGGGSPSRLVMTTHESSLPDQDFAAAR
jgi:AAA15 family ATPase/GTPase